MPFARRWKATLRVGVVRKAFPACPAEEALQVWATMACSSLHRAVTSGAGVAENVLSPVWVACIDGKLSRKDQRESRFASSLLPRHQRSGRGAKRHINSVAFSGSQIMIQIVFNTSKEKCHHHGHNLQRCFLFHEDKENADLFGTRTVPKVCPRHKATALGVDVMP